MINVLFSSRLFSPQTDESHKQKVCKNSCFIVLEKELGSVQNFLTVKI